MILTMTNTSVERAMERTVVACGKKQTAVLSLRADIKALYENGAPFNLYDLLQAETSKYESLAVFSLDDILVSLDTNGDEDDMFAEYWINRKDAEGIFRPHQVISDCEYELPDLLGELFLVMLKMAVEYSF